MSCVRAILLIARAWTDGAYADARVHANANAGGPVIDILQVEEEIGRKTENAVLQGVAL